MAVARVASVAALLAVAVLVAPSAGEKIVWIPYAAMKSHMMLAVKTLSALKERGHDVIVVNADFSGHGHYDNIDLQGVTYLSYEYPWAKDVFDDWVRGLASRDPFTGTSELVRQDVDVCNSLLGNKALMAKIADADVIVLDNAWRCGSVVRDVLKTKVRVDFHPVTFSDPFFMPRVGSSNPIHAIPQLGSKIPRVSGFGDRVLNTIVWLVDKYIEHSIADKTSNELRAKWGLEGTHKQAMADTGMLIVQTSWAIEYPQPVPPVVKLVGPILPSPAKPLPEDLENFIAAGKANGGVGTVLASFGSQAILTQDLVDRVTEALGKFNGTVIWRPPNVMPTSAPDNVRVVKWLPQNDILGHPDVVAFLSHGGLNGVSEAAYHGVPVVGFPLFADQWDNIARLEFRGMAKTVDAMAFTAESLAADITEVVTNPSYAAAAKKVSAIIRDTPKPPVELAADWIEYALRHDGALFQQVPWAPDTPWVVERGVDVFAALVILPVAVAYAICRACCCNCERKPSHTHPKSD